MIIDFIFHLETPILSQDFVFSLFLSFAFPNLNQSHHLLLFSDHKNTVDYILYASILFDKKKKKNLRDPSTRFDELEPKAEEVPIGRERKKKKRKKTRQISGIYNIA